MTHTKNQNQIDAKNEAQSSECLNEALVAGGIAGVKASAVVGGAYWLVMKYSTTFRYNFSASARTALVVLPIFYSTWLNTELAMHNCMKNRTKSYILGGDDDDVVAVVPKSV